MHMRILHILDHSPPRASSYSRRVMAILRHQRALGWKTMHLTGPGHTTTGTAAHGIPERVASSGSAGWHFFRTSSPGALATRLPLLGPVHLIAQRLQQVVQMTRPQLLHAHSPVELALAALRVGRQHGLPVLFEAHAPAPFSVEGSTWRAPPGDEGAASHGGASSLTLQSPQQLSCLARFGMRALEAWAAQRAAAVVTNSEGMCARLMAAGVAGGRITLVPDGLDPDRYSPSLRSRFEWGANFDGGPGWERRTGRRLPLAAHLPERRRSRAGTPPRPLVLGYAPVCADESGGSAGSVAGLHVLLVAMTMLQHTRSRLHLAVACGGGQESMVRKLGEQHGLEDCISIVMADQMPQCAAVAAGVEAKPVAAFTDARAHARGEFPRTQAVGQGLSAHAALHGLADIVVFPQAARNSAAAPPRQLLEAMARGCIIAAADTPAHRAVIDHGRDGVLFTPGDPAALSDAIQVLIAGAGRSQMRTSARWFIDYHRSWEVCTGKYVPLYEKLLAGRRRR